jgi:hypothetical protein
MDLKDYNKYDSNECYCTQYHKYYNPNDKACSSYFVHRNDPNNLTSSYSSGCYLTTITCELSGLDDNCEYLTKLRSFRENYMKKDSNLIPILIEYDIIGPKIVNSLKNDNFKNIKAFMMLELYIKPIVKLLDEKKYTQAIQKYISMTEQLKEFYQIETPNIQINEDIDISDIGKGHQLQLIK